MHCLDFIAQQYNPVTCAGGRPVFCILATAAVIMCWAAGAELPLPEGYAGFVLQKNAVELDGEMGKSWHTTGKFERLSYWNHDTPADGMDPAPRALEWLSLSIAVRTYLSWFSCSLVYLSNIVHQLMGHDGS